MVIKYKAEKIFALKDKATAGEISQFLTFGRQRHGYVEYFNYIKHAWNLIVHVASNFCFTIFWKLQLPLGPVLEMFPAVVCLGKYMWMSCFKGISYDILYMFF